MSSNLVAKLSLADEILYLIFEFIAIISVMYYVAVVATILVLVPLCSLLLYGEWSSEMGLSFVS